jgi:hypothetical protein
MTEGRQPFTAEIKTLAKGPSTYDPLENDIRKQRPFLRGGAGRSRRPKASFDGRSRFHLIVKRIWLGLCVRLHGGGGSPCPKPGKSLRFW